MDTIVLLGDFKAYLRKDGDNWRGMINEKNIFPDLNPSDELLLLCQRWIVHNKHHVQKQGCSCYQSTLGQRLSWKRKRKLICMFGTKSKLFKVGAGIQEGCILSLWYQGTATAERRSSLCRNDIFAISRWCHATAFSTSRTNPCNSLLSEKQSAPPNSRPWFSLRKEWIAPFGLSVYPYWRS